MHVFKADRANSPWADQRLLGHPNFQWAEAARRPSHPNVHRHYPLNLDIIHTVSLGVAQHIAGNILHEIFYVALADM